jgi:hypothetical protein
LSTHGSHFDVFQQQAGSPHGGAEFDRGFGLTPLPIRTASTSTASPRAANVTKHGERWDEFGWNDMPTGHGRNFDADFAADGAQASHGTWFDVFSGGTQLRYVGDGNHELRGRRPRPGADHATVQRRDGKPRRDRAQPDPHVARGQRDRHQRRRGARPSEARACPRTPRAAARSPR